MPLHQVGQPQPRGRPAYLPNLPISLNNLGIWLSNLGQREAALTPTEEAVALYQRLAEGRRRFSVVICCRRCILADLLDDLDRDDEAAELRRQIGGDAAPDDG